VGDYIHHGDDHIPDRKEVSHVKHKSLLFLTEPQETALTILLNLELRDPSLRKQYASTLNGMFRQLVKRNHERIDDPITKITVVDQLNSVVGCLTHVHRIIGTTHTKALYEIDDAVIHLQAALKILDN